MLFIPIWALVYLCENLIINVPKEYIETWQHYKIKLGTDTQGAREFLTFASFPLLLFVYRLEEVMIFLNHKWNFVMTG